MRGLLLDLTPLRESPAFRWFWLGRAVSALGGQLTVVGVMWQVWQATHSPFWSGSVAVAQAVPMIVLGLWGGALADRGERRTILLVTTVGQCVVSLLLAVQALALGTEKVAVVVVLALVVVQTGFSAGAGGAGRAVIPALLPARHVAAGMALNRLSFQAAMLAGPAVAGVVIGYLGLEWAYVIDAVTFVASFAGVRGLPRLAAASTTRAGIVAGLRFVVTHPVVRGVLLTDLAATLLAMPVSLFPLINQERFGGDARTLGLFLSAIAVGGVVASLFAGAFTRRTHLGAVTLAGAVCWGAALAGAGLVSERWVVLALLAVAGAADTLTVVTRGTLVQLAVPDELRGRAAAVEMVVGIAGPDLGNLRAGAVAQWTSGSFALVSGGLSCLVALAAVAVTTPDLRRFRTDRVGLEPTGGQQTARP